MITDQFSLIAMDGGLRLSCHDCDWSVDITFDLADGVTDAFAAAESLALDHASGLCQ